MADNVEKVLFELSLDDAQFVNKILNAKKQTEELGSGEQLKGFANEFNKITGQVGEFAEIKLPLISAELVEMLPIVALVATSAFAFKEAFDLTLEAENLNAVNKEFEILTNNAGLNTKELKENIALAVKGFMDEDSALKMANESILKLGGNAERLPELFQLARQASLVMGTSVTDSMNSITMAVASGNQRMLKRLGLNVDLKKAEEEFAKSLGVSVEALSQEGKQAATLNAVLEEGKKKFDGIDESIKPVQTALDKLHVAWKEIGQTIAEIVGPIFSKFFSGTIEYVTSSINFYKSWIALLKNGGKEQEKIDDELSMKRQAHAAIAKRINDEDKKAQDDKFIDKKKEAELEAKFENEMAALHKKAVEEDVKNAKTEEQLKEAQNARLRVLEEENLAKISAIKADPKWNPVQKNKLIEAQAQQHQSELSKIELRGEQERENMWKNYQKTVTSISASIAGHFKAEVTGMSKGNKAMVDLGKKDYESLKNTSFNAFEAMGQSAVTGQNMVTHAVLGGLGEIASNHGKFMMLDAFSTFPFVKGPELAAGAALIALGGALGSIGAGGGGTADVPTSSGGDSTSSSALASQSNTSPTISADQSAVQHKSLSVVVHGSIIDTDTKMRLVDMIREASDATDYKYTLIGGR